MGWSSKRRLASLSALLLGLMLHSPAQAPAYASARPEDHGAGGERSEAGAPSINISAKVDKTAVDLGNRLTLTITLDGDLTNVNMQDFKLPPGLQIVAQSRASNVSMGGGEVKRSVSLIYVLLAQEPGTFQLGPFQIIHQGKPVLTEPIEIVVKKPLVPPTQKDTQRYTL